MTPLPSFSQISIGSCIIVLPKSPSDRESITNASDLITVFPHSIFEAEKIVHNSKSVLLSLLPSLDLKSQLDPPQLKTTVVQPNQTINGSPTESKKPVMTALK